MLKAVAKVELDDNKIDGKEEYKKRIEEGKTKRFEFERDTKQSKIGESWNWLKKEELRRETESLIYEIDSLVKG